MGSDADSTPSFPAVDWGLYQRLKAEGRLNLLFQQGPEMAARLLNDKVTGCVPNVLPFVSRAEHLAWRKQWVAGRWQIRSLPPELRAATLKQDAIYRERDAQWAENHGPVPAGARVLRFLRKFGDADGGPACYVL
jgi:hypothetical protein